LEIPAGDADRVLLGGLTAMESVVDATVDNEALEPVRRSDAASLGRGADVVAVGVGWILAASWLREGGRPAPGGLTGFSLVVAFELIVVVARRLQRWRCLVGQWRPLRNRSIQSDQKATISKEFLLIWDRNTKTV